MPPATLQERVRYRFDTWMARGTGALMALLGLATLAFVVVAGVVTWVVLKLTRDDRNLGDDTAGPLDLIWRSLMRTLDPGTMGGDEGWVFRILMLIVTVGGLVLVAGLIGIVSGAFDARVEDLRKGRSRVLEEDHTLILGWSPKVFSIVEEICLANRSRGGSVIVLLADRDKVEMEDAIRAHVPDTGKTRIIVRSGDPMALADLAIVTPQEARSVIVLGDEDSDAPDAEVIKTALAVTHRPPRRGPKYHIVGELRDPANLEAARLIGGEHAHWVLSAEAISRIAVQTSRQNGLSVVYAELLGFAGAEMYFTEQPSLVGRTFLEAQLSFPDCSVLGLASGDAVRLNPPADTVIPAGDRIVVIADDDTSIRVTAPATPRAGGVVDAAPRSAVPETTVVLGWNSKLTMILVELDEYSHPGSRVQILADVPAPDIPETRNLEVTFDRADPTSRTVLEENAVHGYDHALVLAREDLGAQQADARTLVILLHLRDLGARHGRTPAIVSEMLDDRNRELAEVTRADDFIVSDRIISLMLSQSSEAPQLIQVFEELFTSSGIEIYLRPAGDYVEPGAESDFATVVATASARGETALGYRRAADARDAAKLYGVTVNPAKAAPLVFDADDRVIVLAES